MHLISSSCTQCQLKARGRSPSAAAAREGDLQKNVPDPSPVEAAASRDGVRAVPSLNAIVVYRVPFDRGFIRFLFTHFFNHTRGELEARGAPVSDPAGWEPEGAGSEIGAAERRAPARPETAVGQCAG